MRRAQATARSTGQSIQRSMGGISTRVSETFAGIRVAAAGLGLALGAGFLIQQGRAALEFAASLSETAQRIGVTVEQLQILSRAAQESGASQEGLERALMILNRTLGQARAGLPDAIRSFRAIGITPEQIRSFHTAGEAFETVSRQLNRLRSDAELQAAGSRLMGRGFSELIPLIREGTSGMERWTREAQAAGLITEEQARQADAAMDALGRLAATIRTDLAGALTAILPYIQEVVADLQVLVNAARAAAGALASIPGARSGLETGISAVTNPLGAPIRILRDTARNVYRRFFGDGRTGSVSASYRPPARGGGTELDLSPHGGGGRHSDGDAERKRALRDEHQFQSDLRRERIQQLEEARNQTNDYVEQSNIQLQINGLNREQFKSDLDLRVALRDLTAEKEVQLLQAYDQSDEARRITLGMSVHADWVREQATIAENEYNSARAALQQQEAIADTAEERRRIGLELLDLDYQYRRLKLQQIVREQNVYDEATRLDAQAQLDRMATSQARDRASVTRGTRGPLEEYLAGLPTTAARAREALQGVAVEGLQGISDGLADIITGTRKWGDVFKDVAQRIIADLIKIQIEQRLIPMLANLIPGFSGSGGGGTSMSWDSVVSAVGSLPGRAIGGPVLPGRAYVVGERGPEILRMGGLAGHIVSNDNIGGGGIVIHQTFAPSFAGNAPTREEMLFLAGQVKRDTLDVVRQINRRRA